MASYRVCAVLHASGLIFADGTLCYWLVTNLVSYITANSLLSSVSTMCTGRFTMCTVCVFKEEPDLMMNM